MKASVLCSKNFPVAKSLKIREGEYQGLPSKSFCLTVRKSFAGETFCAVFQKNSGSENFKGKRGGISRFSNEKFLSHSAKNFRR